MKLVIDRDKENEMKIGDIVKDKLGKDAYIVIQLLGDINAFALMNLDSGNYMTSIHRTLKKLEASINKEYYDIYSSDDYILKLVSKIEDSQK